jgi:hypothetical protein
VGEPVGCSSRGLRRRARCVVVQSICVYEIRWPEQCMPMQVRPTRVARLAADCNGAVKASEAWLCSSRSELPAGMGRHQRQYEGHSIPRCAVPCSRQSGTATPTCNTPRPLVLCGAGVLQKVHTPRRRGPRTRSSRYRPLQTHSCLTTRSPLQLLLPRPLPWLPRSTRRRWSSTSPTTRRP